MEWIILTLLYLPFFYCFTPSISSEIHIAMTQLCINTDSGQSSQVTLPTFLCVRCSGEVDSKKKHCLVDLHVKFKKSLLRIGMHDTNLKVPTNLRTLESDREMYDANETLEGPSSYPTLC